MDIVRIGSVAREICCFGHSGVADTFLEHNMERQKEADSELLERMMGGCQTRLR